MVIVGAKLDKQVEHLVYNLFGSCALTVNLVDYNERCFFESECLFKHKSCLRHTALKRIDKEQNAVNHCQNTLNLTAEIGVARGINDIDFCVLIMDRSVF